MDRLLKQIEELFPGIDIIIIGQNYQDYMPSCGNKILLYKYDKLGITGARRALRKAFLNSKYDCMIMFDDDSLIEGTKADAEDYLSKIDEHSNCFMITNDGLLRLAVATKNAYTLFDYPLLEAENSEFFEDIYIKEVFKKYYPELYVDIKTKLRDATWDERYTVNQSTYWRRDMRASKIKLRTYNLIEKYKNANQL